MTEEVDNKEPGLSLARARQEKGFAVDEVAARLHLSAVQIQSLEENEYDSLPEATYVKGYIKNYAKLLELDPAPLIAAYIERVSPKKNDTIETVAVSQQKLSTSDDLKVMYTIIGIVVLVIAIVGIWIGTQGYNEKASGQAETTETTAEAASDDLFGPQLEAQTDEGSGLDSEAENDIADTSLQAQEQPEPQYPAAPKQPETISAITPVTKTSQPAISTKAKKESAPDNNQAARRIATDNKKTEIPVESVRLDEIVLFFEENSWVDVRDTNDKKLLYKTIDEGRVVTIKGIAPFKIFLGNADGVKLSYNGKQVNFDKYKRGLIARFTVGKRE
ncbi:MAG: helix-turn-helix domain-containing protein [Acidiferrobacterales bacterium]